MMNEWSETSENNKITKTPKERKVHVNIFSLHEFNFFCKDSSIKKTFEVYRYLNMCSIGIFS